MKKLKLSSSVLMVAALSVLLSACGDPSKSEAPAMVEGRLAGCPDKPNCVQSEYPSDSEHYIAPIDISGNPLTVWKRLQDAVHNTGGRIVEKENLYIAATYTTDLVKFVDDVQLRVDLLGQKIQVRSVSRVGYSDLGANAKRVEAIRAAFAK